MTPLNLFYKEPEADRWIRYDRYPRRIIRDLLRGPKRPGGHGMVATNLMKGLDLLGVPYRLNDFAHARKHPEELACIIGKDYLLDARKWENPILLGASIFSHPLAYPDLFEHHPNVRKVVVPGQWMRDMFQPYYGEKVAVWPVGNDTEEWSPALKKDPTVDFLLYNKIRWRYPDMQEALLQPIRSYLKGKGYRYEEVRYLHYMPRELKEKLGRARACLFLCEHETQGLAYQQVLATGTPILAWDRGGYWQDPLLYPDKVKFGPVSSVPYWDHRCGVTFRSFADFPVQLDSFLEKLDQHQFQPRDYILENLTLETCAQAYVNIAAQLIKELHEDPVNG